MYGKPRIYNSCLNFDSSALLQIIKLFYGTNLIDMRNVYTCPKVNSIHKPSSKDFLTIINKSRQPLLVTGLMDKWKSRKLWTLDFFEFRYGNTVVSVEQVDKPFEKKTINLSEYINYIKNTDDQNPYYLKDWQFYIPHTELLKDYETPVHFENWFKQLPNNSIPRWIYIGSKNNGSKLHQDLLMTSAWNAVFCGKKCWLIYPPNQGDYVYYGEVDAFYPDLEKYPLFNKARPLICWQNPGEILFMPSGWWHQVVNEEACISLTENFVNESNYELVREYIDKSKLSSESKQELNFFIPQLGIQI
jgi:histone arginine demethylase JMJD6